MVVVVDCVVVGVAVAADVVVVVVGFDVENCCCSEIVVVVGVVVDVGVVEAFDAIDGSDEAGADVECQGVVVVEFVVDVVNIAAQGEILIELAE